MPPTLSTHDTTRPHPRTRLKARLSGIPIRARPRAVVLALITAIAAVAVAVAMITAVAAAMITRNWVQNDS